VTSSVATLGGTSPSDATENTFAADSRQTLIKFYSDYLYFTLYFGYGVQHPKHAATCGLG